MRRKLVIEISTAVSHRHRVKIDTYGLHPAALTLTAPDEVDEVIPTPGAHVQHSERRRALQHRIEHGLCYANSSEQSIDVAEILECCLQVRLVN
jgi:hypothetical protein